MEASTKYTINLYRHVDKRCDWGPVFPNRNAILKKKNYSMTFFGQNRTWA